MKQLLSWGGAGLLTGAFLDPIYQSGIGNPVPWGRDLTMGAAGVLFLYLLVKFRRDL